MVALHSNLQLRGTTLGSQTELSHVYLSTLLGMIIQIDVMVFSDGLTVLTVLTVCFFAAEILEGQPVKPRLSL